jgi:hypothetical protein
VDAFAVLVPSEYILAWPGNSITAHGALGAMAGTVMLTGCEIFTLMVRAAENIVRYATDHKPSLWKGGTQCGDAVSSPYSAVKMVDPNAQ